MSSIKLLTQANIELAIRALEQFKIPAAAVAGQISFYDV